MFFNTASSASPQIPLLYIGGCWVRTQDCCDFGIHTRLDLIHTRLDRIHTRLDLIHTRLDLIHNSTRSRPQSAKSHPHSAGTHPHSATSHPHIQTNNDNLYLFLRQRCFFNSSPVRGCFFSMDQILVAISIICDFRAFNSIPKFVGRWRLEHYRRYWEVNREQVLSPNFLRFSQPARFSTISMAFSEMLRYSVKR